MQNRKIKEAKSQNKNMQYYVTAMEKTNPNNAYFILNLGIPYMQCRS